MNTAQHGSLLQIPLQGRMEGKWPRGRRRTMTVDGIKNKQMYAAMKRTAEDRETKDTRFQQITIDRLIDRLNNQ